MSETATVTLDVSGLPCPAPLLGAKKLIDDLQPGQKLVASVGKGQKGRHIISAKLHTGP